MAVRTVYGRPRRRVRPRSRRAGAWRGRRAPTCASKTPRFGSISDHEHRWVGEIATSREKGAIAGGGEVSDGVTEAVNVRVGNRTVAVSTPLYWSASRIGGAEDGLVIDSVSLTASPARVYPSPVTLPRRRLDHREAAERWRSRLDRDEYALLERAANARAERSGGRRPDRDRRTRRPGGDGLGRRRGWIDEMNR